MFEKQVDAKIKGAIFVDVTAPPRGVFTRKRDALAASSSASGLLNAYLEELAVDPLSALKKERAEKGKERIIYTGNGLLNVRDGEGARVAEEERARRKARTAEVGAEMAIKIDLTKTKVTKGGSVELTGDQLKSALELLTTFLNQEQEAADTAQDNRPVDQSAPELVPLPETFESIAKDSRFVNTEQLAGALQFAAWKPDLFVYQNLDNWKMPKDFNPLTMKPKYLRLMRLWAELCKYALVRLGMFNPFGVGWIFDTETDELGDELVMGAGSLRENGIEWLLLNPVKMKRSKSSSDDYPEYEVLGDYYDLSSDASIEELCASVIHEVTHMQGFGKHDQRYAYALTRNIKIAFGMDDAAKKILKGVNRVVREEVKERKAAREVESQIPWDALIGKTILATRIGYMVGTFYSDLGDVSKGKVSVAEAIRQLSEEPSKMADPDRAQRAMTDGFRVYDSSDVNPRAFLRLYEALRDKGLLPAVSNEQASKYTENVFYRGFDLPDVRERGEAVVPSNVGVYNVTKRTKDGETQWVLREGYSGLRGKEIASGKTYRGDDLVIRDRYNYDLYDSARGRPDGLWVVWAPRAGSATVLVGFPSPKLKDALGFDSYAEITVRTDGGGGWSVVPYGTRNTVRSMAAGAKDSPTMLSAAEAQAEVMRQVSAALSAKSAEPVKEVRDRVPVPTDMSSDEFVRLFPLFAFARMMDQPLLRGAEVAELYTALKEGGSRLHVARELGETVMIEGPEFLFAFEHAGTEWEIPLRSQSMASTLESYGREMIREYFDKGGVELSSEEFEPFVRKVVSAWKLRDTPLALTRSEVLAQGVYTVLV